MESTDHDLLVAISEHWKELREWKDVIERRLHMGEQKFLNFALSDQEIRAAITDLRQNFSRSMLSADEAKRIASDIERKVDKRLHDIEDKIDERFTSFDSKFDELFTQVKVWRAQLAIIIAILLFVVSIISQIIVDIIKKFI